MSGDNPGSIARLLAERRRSWSYLRVRRQQLAEQMVSAERDLAELDRVHPALPDSSTADLSVFDWGELPLLTPAAAERIACQRKFIRQFLTPEIASWPGPLLEIISEADAEPLADGAATLLPADESLPAALRQLPAAHYAVVLLPHIINLMPNPRLLLFACRRVLRRGGLLVATLPGAAAPQCAEPARDRWRFTPASAGRLLSDYFPARELKISAAGSMADAVAAWYGLSERQWSGCPPAELPLIIFAQARKP